jgi:hypothetical protein
MKDIFFAILFFVIFIIFGVLIYTNQEILIKLEKIEKRIDSCENSIMMGIKTDDMQFKILGELLDRIEKIQRRNFVLN